MRFDPSIFKAYDIRGIYPAELNADTAYAIGRAYATFLYERAHIIEGRAHLHYRAGGPAAAKGPRLRVAVGSDMRLSSPMLKSRLIEALIQTGIDVDDLGLVSTPTFYFAVAFYGYDGGIQVSASHNPKEYNGFKMVAKGAAPIGEKTGLSEMREIVAHDHFAPLVAPEQRGEVNWRGRVTETEVLDQMRFAGLPTAATSDIARFIKPFKIAIDASNGMGGVDMDTLFDRLPCQLVKLNFNLDGTFPAHGPNPMHEENLAALSKAVVENGCDFGIAPDGDGDRYFFIDEKGDPVPQAIIRGLMARVELRIDPDAVVAYDVRPGRITADIIEEERARNGGRGRSIVTPVGHSLIKQQMIAEGAVFGGESSGHYFYKLPYGTFEAPTVLVVKLLAFLSSQADADGRPKPLSQIVLPYKRYFNSGEIDMPLETRTRGEEKIEEIATSFADGTRGPDGMTKPYAFLDGVTVEYDDYWFNVRLSNTEPLIRLIVEAKTRALMEQKRDELKALIER